MQSSGYHPVTPQHVEGYSLSESSHPGSGYSTAYDSPGSSHWEQDGMGIDRTNGYADHRNVPAYEWTEDPESSYPHPYHSSSSAQPQPFVHQSASSLNTSDNNGRTLRNTRTSSRPKQSKQPRTKKTAKPKEGAKAMVMPGPITELGKDSGIELFDIEAYIERSDDQRQREADAAGKIKRPMNAYIMYRKVYQERVKEYSKETNHQTISQLVSSSWAQEGQELRDRYAHYASIERDNHMKAHPDYKFQPKARTSKKRKGEGVSDDELSDLDASGSEWGASRYGRSRPKQARRDRSFAMLEEDIFGGRESSYGWDDGYQHAAYHTVNPGRPPPMPMSSMDVHPGYYPSMVPSGVHRDVSTAYGDSIAVDEAELFSGPRVSGVPGMADTLLGGPDRANPMDPMLQEPWSSGAFTSDQFNEYNQYHDMANQGTLPEGRAEDIQREIHGNGSYGNADIDALLRTGEEQVH